jgi:Spy/CpxP family protein refolding chaperone
MKRWIRRSFVGLFGLVGLAAIAGGVAGCAHRESHAWRTMSEQDVAQMKGRMIEKVGHKLDLDEAQKARLGVLADTLRQQRNAMIGETKDPRAEMQSLVAGPTFDRARANTLAQTKLNAAKEGAPAIITAAADFYDSLRPDQQAKLRDFMASRGHRG